MGLGEFACDESASENDTRNSFFLFRPSETVFAFLFYPFLLTVTFHRLRPCLRRQFAERINSRRISGHEALMHLCVRTCVSAVRSEERSEELLVFMCVSVISFNGNVTVLRWLMVRGRDAGKTRESVRILCIDSA